jgi:hypothetical protein
MNTDSLSDDLTSALLTDCEAETKLVGTSKTKIESLRTDVQAYLYHRNNKNKQRASFNDMKDNVKEGECVFVLDFKENVKIGSDPVETQYNFFHQRPCSVLGFVLYYVEGGRIVKKHINYVSSVLSHDAFFASQCCIDVVKKHCASFTNLKVWSDCGLHFRCGEMMRTLLLDLPHQLQKKVSVNFFVEHHGKNPCDPHFSTLSTWLKEMKASRPIHSVDDLVAAWRTKAAEQSEAKIIFEVFNPKEADPLASVLKIPDLKTYYSLQSAESPLLSRKHDKKRVIQRKRGRPKKPYEKQKVSIRVKVLASDSDEQSRMAIGKSYVIKRNSKMRRATMVGPQPSQFTSTLKANQLGQQSLQNAFCGDLDVSLFGLTTKKRKSSQSLNRVSKRQKIAKTDKENEENEENGE